MRRSRARRPLPPAATPHDAAPHDPGNVRRRLDDRLAAPSSGSASSPTSGSASSPTSTVLPSSRPRRPGRARAAVAVAAAAVLGVVAVAQLGSDDDVPQIAVTHDQLADDQLADEPAQPAQPDEAEPPADDAGAPAGPPAPQPADEGGRPVTLAFAGDVHAERSSGAALRAGLPSIRAVLSNADLTVLNVEMAITERGTPAPKQFTFRAPASTLPQLLDAGVDVASLANNHGLDYGQEGLTDTLAAADAVGLPVVGLGQDEASAYAPHVVTVEGERIAVLGATQVLDGNLQEAWTAQPGKPGMASAKRVERLVQEVERAAALADTVVVYLHWGKEREACPLPRQEELAAQLVAAGADVIVGTHAHVLLGGGYLDGAYVDYGLGNFVFGARNVESARSGVLTVTVQDGEVLDSAWVPAVIRDGAPHPLSGAEAAAAVADKDGRRACTNLSAAPSA